jgi:hypothetical protein
VQEETVPSSRQRHQGTPPKKGGTVFNCIKTAKENNQNQMMNTAGRKRGERKGWFKQKPNHAKVQTD